MSKSYFDVKKEYDAWRDQTGLDIGLGEFAQFMDATTGSQERHRAYNPGIGTTVNAYIDKFFSPVGNTLRPVGEFAGDAMESVFGFDDDFSDQAGEIAASLPRTAAEFASWMIPGGAIPKAGLMAAKGLSAGSAFVRGQAETGNIAGGAISAAMLPAIPGAGKLAENYLSKSLFRAAAGKEAAKLTSGRAVKEILDEGGQAVLPRYFAAQAGMFGAGAVGDVAMGTAATGSLEEGLGLLADPEYWALQSIGQIPFFALDIPRVRKDLALGVERSKVKAKERQEEWDAMTVAARSDAVDKRNAKLDKLADELVKMNPETKKFRKKMDEWINLIPKSADGQKPYITPKLWKASKEQRPGASESFLMLTRAYNETVTSLKAADNMSRFEINIVRDQIFGDGPITADKLAKAYESRLEKGEGYDEATLRVYQMVENKLARLTKENLKGQEGKVQDLGDAAEFKELDASYPDKGNLYTDLVAYAQRSFEQSGFSPEMVKRFADIIERTAHLYPNTQDVRVAELKERAGQSLKGVAGLYMNSGLKLANNKEMARLVGLMTRRFDKDSDYTDAFVRASIAAHELFHARDAVLLENNSIVQLSGPDRIAAFNLKKAYESIKLYSQEDRLKLLQTMEEIVMPPEIRKNLSFAEYGAKTYKETVTVMAQYIAMHALGGKAEVSSNNLTGRIEAGEGFQDLIRWMPDEISEWMQGFYRDLNEYHTVLDDWQTGKRFQTTVDKADKAANTQRLFPEHQMRESQKKISDLIGQNRLVEVIEHIGDLAHRVQEKTALGGENAVQKLKNYIKDTDITKFGLPESLEIGIWNKVIEDRIKAGKADPLDTMLGYEPEKLIKLKTDPEAAAEYNVIKDEIVSTMVDYFNSHSKNSRPATRQGLAARDVTFSMVDDVIDFLESNGKTTFKRSREKAEALLNDLEQHGVQRDIGSDHYLSQIIKRIDSVQRSFEEVTAAKEALISTTANMRPEVLPEIDRDLIRERYRNFLRPGSKGDPDPIKLPGFLADKFISDKDVNIKTGEQLNWLTRMLGNPSQLASRLEKRGLTAASRVINYVQDIPAAISKHRNTMMMPFTTTNSGGKRVSMLEMDIKDVKPEDRGTKLAIDLILANDDAWVSFSDIARMHNAAKRGLGPDDPEFQAAVEAGGVRGYNKLNAEEKSQVWDMIGKFKQQNRAAAQLIKMAELNKISFVATKILRQENPNLSTEAAYAITNRTASYIGTNLKDVLADPTILPGIIQQLQQQYGGNLKASRTLAFMKEILPDYQKVAGVLDEQSDYYFSERRFGRYLLTYKKKVATEDGFQEEVFTEAYPDKPQLKAREEELAQELAYDIKAKDKHSGDRRTEVIGSNAMLNALRPMEQAAYEKALRYLGEEDAKLMREMYDPGEVMIAEVKKAQMADFMKPRKLKSGREQLDMFHTGIDYYNSLSYKLANDMAKGFSEMFLTDKQLNAHPQLRAELMSWADNLVKPQSKEFQNVKNGIFSYFLGFNLSSMLIESVQPMLTTIPMIIEEMGTVRGSYGLVGKSYKMLAKAYSSSRTKDGRLAFDDPELTKLFNQAIDEDLLDYGSIEDMARPEDAMKVNVALLREGKKGMTPAELTTQPFHWFSRYGRKTYSAVSGLNAKNSFITGYQMGKKKGLSGNALYRYASAFVRRTTFSGGEYNRAFGFKNLGKAQGAAGVAYTLTNFTYATMHMMGRLADDAIRGSNLSKAQQKQARKAFYTMMGTQGLFAGAFGMPFAGAALAIAEGIFGESLQDDVRTFIAGMDDDPLGGILADVATRGLPTLLGIDAGSRFGLGSVLGLNEYNGFDMRNLTGAGGGIAQNIYDAITFTAQQQPGRAVESVLPQVLKPFANHARTGGKHLDNKGELLMEPTDTEQFLFLIGLRPKRLSDIRMVQRMSRKANDSANRERRQRINEVIDRIENVSPYEAQQTISNLVANDPLFKYDEYDDVVNRVVEVMLERQVPIDPLESGSYASLDERERFAKTLPTVGKRRISEQQRLLLKNQLKGQITGEFEQPSKRQLTQATMIDQFLQMNPTTSRQRARLEVGADRPSFYK
jgi:hypothetical protein